MRDSDPIPGAPSALVGGEGGWRVAELSNPSGESTHDSIPELVQRLSEQTTRLVRQELRLAQLELKEKGKKAGIGVGLFGGSALLALCALGALVAGLILLIGKAVDLWIAAFIVAGGFGLMTAILVFIGKKEVKQAAPPKPEAAIGSFQADVAEIKARARRS